MLKISYYCHSHHAQYPFLVNLLRLICPQIDCSEDEPPPAPPVVAHPKKETITIKINLFTVSLLYRKQLTKQGFNRLIRLPLFFQDWLNQSLYSNFCSINHYK